MDNILRVYPIHFKSISHHDNEPLLNQANKQTRIIKEKSEDLLDDKLSSNFNPKTNQSKKFGNASTNNLNKLKVIYVYLYNYVINYILFDKTSCFSKIIIDNHLEVQKQGMFSTLSM
ncbi:unnamed protein product [Schistosoma margrebowiei]|uniref:Uncharacterized protein n=1 Tax=Schistosoma margrebowiei TaxID=48269 RepID=A0A183M4J4_9TREM|nr:unnamed protein product [Schistosoma margrebowiei]